jgi:hypothetical protein
LPAVCARRWRGKTLSHRTYNTLTALIFLIVVVTHLLRIIFDCPARIGSWMIPVWVSWPAIVVAGALAAFGFRQNRAPAG